VEDPAAVVTPRPDGRSWLSFRVRFGGEFVSFFADEDFVKMLHRLRREHRRVYDCDGPFAKDLVFAVCAEGPAIFSFTLSFFLYALEQPEAQVRHQAMLLREPSPDPAVVEWIEIPLPAFCRLARDGFLPGQMSVACIREWASGNTAQADDAVADDNAARVL
jgi:hypothetical protein